VLLSDGDREQLFELLSQHAAAGRLTLEELELRVGVVAEASTREECAGVIDDLPPLPSGAAALSAPGRWRTRQHGTTGQPSADWQATNERFRDQRTQQIMRVWVDSAGGRHYVPDSDRP
jgi:Domain of unknown function (DUF1707)